MCPREGIKAVLWDLDDTLYSRKAAAEKVFHGMFRELLYPSRDEEYISRAVSYMMKCVRPNSMVSEEAFSELLKKYEPELPFSRPDCLDYYYAHMPDFAVPYPTHIKIIKGLRSLGIKNAIVTNIYPERVAAQRAKIKALGIEDLFEEIIISGEVGIRKPDRGIYDLAASRLGVKNSECIFVGDDPGSDIKGAIGADMEAVWLDVWGYGNIFQDEPKVHRVSSLEEYFLL